MPYHILASFTSARGNNFQGQHIAHRGSNLIEIASFTTAFLSPRDVATGKVFGTRERPHITFATSWGPAIPEFFQAFAQNETIPKAEFNFYAPDNSGETLALTINVVNAVPVSIVQQSARRTGDLPRVIRAHGQGLDTEYVIHMVAETIALTRHASSHSTFSDSWTS